MDQGSLLNSRLEKLETLLEVNRQLSRELDLDRLLALIAEAAIQIMDADRWTGLKMRYGRALRKE
jgi:hypothetical protein